MSLKDFAIKQGLPILARIAPGWTEKLKVNFAVNAEKGRRPHPYSLWTGMGMDLPPDGRTADTAAPLAANAPGNRPEPAATRPFAPSGYVSWPGLADRRYTGRHLPAADESYAASLPDKEQVVRTLLLRPPGGFTPCRKTSTLFCFFAQWFTDSFLRTDPNDRRRNTSNHEIDYCQIYGLDERTTLALRERRGGRMRLDNGFLPRLVGADGAIRPEFADLSYVRVDGEPATAEALAPGGNGPGDRLRAAFGKSLGQPLDDDRWAHMYASGLERGNSTLLYTALSTMGVREHNRVARVVEGRHPDWDDDRLFETARIVMIRNVLQIVVEDYINHLAGEFDFKLDRSFAEHQSWYRSNRISLEFNLLYRWHSLVPDSFEFGGVVHDHKGYRFNNAPLEQHGPERLINAASAQRAGRIQLHNTPDFLWRAEVASLDMARTFALQPFVAYCERFSRKPPESFEELVGGDARSAAELRALYGSVERVELPIGLIAQARDEGEEDAVLPPLVRTMVAVDAFTHIFTNPLLASRVHEAAFEGDNADLGDLTEKLGGLRGLMRRVSSGDVLAKPSFTAR
jgi:prostaglandin-endoperoxide synthase 2